MKKGDDHNATNSLVKATLLVLLATFYSASIVLGRYTRSVDVIDYRDDLYDIGHFVLVSEYFKAFLSMLLETFRMRGRLLDSLNLHFCKCPMDSLNVSLPALMYFISNSLQIVALSNLSAPMFQVIYQGKVLTTALASVIMLRHRYCVRRWMSLVVVSFGVGLVILSIDRETPTDSTLNSTAIPKNQNIAKGLGAVLSMCFLSAFAGVYFEMVLKHYDKTKVHRPSVWVRNIQLAFFSILFGTVENLVNERKTFTHNRSYFHGFSRFVWLQVVTLAGGGLLVAVVIKYTDNVTKALAMALSVVLSTLVSIVLFGTPVSLQFILGAVLSLLGVFCFSNPLPQCTVKAPSLNILGTIILLSALTSIASVNYYAYTTPGMDKTVPLQSKAKLLQQDSGKNGAKIKMQSETNISYLWNADVSRVVRDVNLNALGTVHVSLVVSHCNKPLDWIESYFDYESTDDRIVLDSVEIFSKCNQSRQLRSFMLRHQSRKVRAINMTIRDLPNVGRNDHTYASWIVKNYDSMLVSPRRPTDVVLFLKDNNYRSNWTRLKFLSLEHLVGNTITQSFGCLEQYRTALFKRGGNLTMNCVSAFHSLSHLREFRIKDYHRDPSRDSVDYFKSPFFETLGQWIDELNLHLRAKTSDQYVRYSRMLPLVPVCYGGQFAATRGSLVGHHPKSSFVKIQQSLSRADNILEGHFAERVWAALLRKRLTNRQLRLVLKITTHVLEKASSLSVTRRGMLVGRKLEEFNCDVGEDLMAHADP
jgi:UDP-sugar transporter A1/2/3